MANALYNSGKFGLMTKQVDLVNDDIRAILIDNADYTVDLAAHDFLDDIPVAARVKTAALANKSVLAAGVFDADDVDLGNTAGDQSESIVLYLHTGTESTSRLIAYIDTATGLPVTPNSGPIIIQWDNGANKIFAL